MLPGKKYSPEDGLAILRRRAWWLLVPLATIAAGAGVYARLQPNMYRSQTRILVVPQRVPESYVRSTVTARIEERLSAISQQVLSRANLEAIIQEFNLYPDERRTGIMEDIVNRMQQRDIRAVPERGGGFVVSFVGRDPRTVMRVTERLGNYFIDESHRDRQLLADGTNDFLETQLKDAKDRLIEHEKKLQAYKERNAGQLPTQIDGNLRSTAALQMQVQSILDQISRDQDRRQVVEGQIADLELQIGDAAVAVPPSAPAPDPATLAAAPLVDQLVAAQQALSAMELRGRKEGHPDHQRQQRVVRDLEAKVDAAMREAPVPSAVPAGPRPSGNELARRRRIGEMRDELTAIDRRVEQNRKKEAELRDASAEYQRRADAGPSRESELVALTRDYGVLQQLYYGLLSNREQAQIAANLVNEQIGERFKMLDRAGLPQRPISPNRQQTVLFGLIAGLGLGVGLVVLLEYRDRSLKTDDDVNIVLSLPVLAVVPFMRSKREQRLNRSKRLMVHATLGSTVLGCFAVLAYSLLS